MDFDKQAFDRWLTTEPEPTYTEVAFAVDRSQPYMVRFITLAAKVLDREDELVEHVADVELAMDYWVEELSDAGYYVDFRDGQLVVWAP